MRQWLQRVWYGKDPTGVVLIPFAWLFDGLVRWRRQQFLSHKKAVVRTQVPVIVVGNISVGGTGKTPLTIWLIEQLQEHGYRPGVISRGYGGSLPSYPHRVHGDDSAGAVGDEPLMIHLRTGVPVVVDPDRGAALKHLLKHSAVDVVISDDGLQHYGLGRTFEVTVVDGQRGFGNGRLLPAGPLREPVERLTSVDVLVVNGNDDQYRTIVSGDLPLPERRFQMQLEPRQAVPLNAYSSPLPPLDGGFYQALAGIGNPQRFFNTLSELEYDFHAHVFPDHHAYTDEDVAEFRDSFILTTEKDATRLQPFSTLRGAYIPIAARLQDGLIDVILNHLRDFKQHSRFKY